MLRIVFMGTPDFAVPSLLALVDAGYQVVGVVTQPDRPRGRKQVLTPPPVKVVAQEKGLPVFQPESIKDPAFLPLLRELQPDVVVVAAYGQILPADVLNLPPLGCVNVHASLLPRYRGAAPIHRAIINGEEETGITIMLMDTGMDTGPILNQASLAIGPDENVGSLHDRLARLGAELLLATLPLLARKEIVPRPQEEELATYAPPLRAEDEIIDWRRAAREVHNHVRGMDPWPGARTYLGEKVLKIWRGQPLPEETSLPPGTVVEVDPRRGFTVATGRGVYLVLEVQPAGGKRMTAAEFVRGGQIKSGLILGGQVNKV